MPGQRIVGLQADMGLQRVGRLAQGRPGTGRRPGRQRQADPLQQHRARLLALECLQRHEAVGRAAARLGQLGAQIGQQARGRSGLSRAGAGQLQRQLGAAQCGLGALEIPQLDGRQGCGIARAELLEAIAAVLACAGIVVFEHAPGIDARVHQHPRARGHQCMLGQAARPGEGLQRQPRARVADALTGQRVGAQIGVGAVVHQVIGLLHALEHADHAAAGEAGFDQHIEAHAVGFTLHIARKVQRQLGGACLARDDAGLRHLGVATRRRQDAQQQAGDGDHAGLGVAGDAPCDVALGDVRQLVGQHRGQLVTRHGHLDQAQVGAHKAARQREGVDALVAHQERLPGKAGLGFIADVPELARRSDQGRPDALQVLLQQRVQHVVGVDADLAHHLIAQPALGAHVEILRHRVAQRRQVDLGVQRGAGQDQRGGRKQGQQGARGGELLHRTGAPAGAQPAVYDA
mmetsp:Transcript_4778/g.16841  ORF Transcript_4778/g.16841 Transcript_4778/m.16841 type:complete len:461 (+) Transcript_4778:920-2302(+)